MKDQEKIAQISQAQFNDLMTAFAVQTEQFKNQSKEFQKQTQEIVDLKSTVEKQSVLIQELKSENESLKETVEKQSKEIVDLKISIVSLNKRVDHLETSKGMIEGELEKITDNVEKNVILTSVKNKIFEDHELEPRYERLRRAVHKYITHVRNNSPDTQNKESFRGFVSETNELGVGVDFLK